MRPDPNQSPCRLVIVGAGPAGLAAAREAATHGLSSLILDENPRPPGFGDMGPQVRIASGTSVLNLSSDREILWARGGRAGRFRTEQIILATGSTPRVVPFPGWTMPGVVLAEEVPRLLADGTIGPHRRALVAGTDDALCAAITLAKAGVEVVAVVIFGHEAWGENLDIRHGHLISAAHGRERLESVTFGPIESAGGEPAKAQETTVAADLLVIDFGRVADTDLAVLAGCRTEFDPVAGCWVTTRDETMRTTIPGILQARDEDEGRIAAITAAKFAGKIFGSNSSSRILPDRHSAARPSRIPPDLADDSTTICRCEDVTRGAVGSAVAQGARDVSSVKLLTRLGMGDCQGRECSPPAAILIAGLTNQSPGAAGRINPRPPVRPVSLGALANLEDGPPPDLHSGQIP